MIHKKVKPTFPNSPHYTDKETEAHILNESMPIAYRQGQNLKTGPRTTNSVVFPHLPICTRSCNITITNLNFAKVILFDPQEKTGSYVILYPPFYSRGN